MFCAVAAQQVGERIIGTASIYDAYVLVECPKPWPSKAFEADIVPDGLRHFIKEAKAQRSVNFLCIAPRDRVSKTRVLIYEKRESDSGFTCGYVGYEYEADSLDRVADCVKTHWQNGAKVENQIQVRDFLVCTHGMRDRCCARFGRPFYQALEQKVKAGELADVRVWQVSHIGGHRFAPTAISLPDGRYYGRLTVEDWIAIASRQGAVGAIESVYRGWGVLPPPVQILEQRLFLAYGWNWLDCAIIYRCEDSPKVEGTLHVELSVQHSGGEIDIYKAIVQQDTSQPYQVQASCDKPTAKTFVKYVVADCRSVEKSEALQKEQATSGFVSSL